MTARTATISGDTAGAPNNQENPMSPTTDTTTTTDKPKAPKPGRGFTVIELRTPHQASIVKANTKGLPAGAVKFDDRFAIVKNTDGQTVIDKVLERAGQVGIFDRRILDYFTACLLLAVKSLTDPRTSLHAQLIGAGREHAGFGFAMNPDGTLTVHVGDKQLGRQREAFEALTGSKPAARRTSNAAKKATAESTAAAKLQRMADAKAESKAVAAAAAAGEPTPATPALDAINAEHAAKEAAKQARKAS